ncbi:MAG: hypothetical protein M1339_08665 [Bacteroidetes bacterium]|nr:hypothetical protein [Bacteroidota bacterium]
MGKAPEGKRGIPRNVVDDSLVSQQSPYNLIYYTTPYYSTFSFSLQTAYGAPDLFYESAALPVISGINNCDGTSWDPGRDSITLSILAGSRFAEFRDANTRKSLGTSVTVTALNIPSVVVAADLAMPDSAGNQVVISASSNGIIRYDTLIAKPFFFKITADSSEISAGDTSAVTVVGVDAAGNPHSPPQLGFIPGAYYLELYIDKGKGYGSLWDGDIYGDMKTEGDTIYISTYYPNSYSAEKFIADGKTPDDSAVIGLVAKELPIDYSHSRLAGWMIPFPGLDTVTGSAQIVIRNSEPGPDLNLPRYSQGDPRWKDSTYDHTNKTIGADGCALSDMAWVLSAFGYQINPLQLNDWMNDPNNPDPYFRHLVNWSAIYDISGGNLTARETRNSNFGNFALANDPTALNSYLENGDLVIVQVYNKNDKHDPHHWVVVEPGVNGKYPIMDPGNSTASDLSYYGSKFWEYVVVSKSNGK